MRCTRSATLTARKYVWKARTSAPARAGSIAHRRPASSSAGAAFSRRRIAAVRTASTSARNSGPRCSAMSSPTNVPSRLTSSRSGASVRGNSMSRRFSARNFVACMAAPRWLSKATSIALCIATKRTGRTAHGAQTRMGVWCAAFCPGLLLKGYDHMFRSRPLILAMSIALTACSTSAPHKTETPPAAPPTAAAQPAAVNPFLQPSPLQYQAPPFDKIKDTDYQPAIEEGMKQQLAEVEAIANRTEPPTFDNTIVAMERSGALLTRVSKVFNAVVQANTNDALQKVQEEEAPKLAAHQDAIYLNPKLFARIKALYDGRDRLDAESKYLTERYYRNFVRAGAQLSDADQAKLRDLNKEESTLSTDFQNKLLAGTKAGALVTHDPAEFAGLSEGELAAAAAAAKERKLDGAYVLPLQNTTQQPAQVELTSRATREKLFKASTERTEHGDANDTRATIERLAQLRAQKAKLLGYPNYAAYSLDDQMAKTPQHAIKLMTDMVPGAVGKAKSEAARMEREVDKHKGGFKLAPWDWQFYAEQVRKSDYDLDEAKIKRYFELDRVLHDGVFFAANKLYGLTFKERHDLPVYSPTCAYSRCSMPTASRSRSGTPITTSATT